MNPHSIDELLFHMPTVASKGDRWAREFASSVLKQSRRRKWQPSPKQEALMRRLVGEIFEPDEPDLIEEEGREGPAPAA